MRNNDSGNDFLTNALQPKTYRYTYSSTVNISPATHRNKFSGPRVSITKECLANFQYFPPNFPIILIKTRPTPGLRCRRPLLHLVCRLDGRLSKCSSMLLLLFLYHLCYTPAVEKTPSDRGATPPAKGWISAFSPGRDFLRSKVTKRGWQTETIK